MLAWGFKDGTFSSAQDFANRAKNAGYEWAVLEMDDQHSAVENAAIWPDFVNACHAQGILAGVWYTEGGNIRDTPGDADLAIAELEGPGDYDGIMLVIGEQRLPSCPIAVCTNFNVPLIDSGGVPQPDKAAPLIAAGFACLPECYLGDNPNATPDQMDFRARQLGWPTSQPVFGVWNAPPSTYDPWKEWPGVDYLGENVI